MDRLKRRHRPVSKIGMQVPAHVHRELARKHPTVSILWNRQTERWVLLHKDGDGVQMVHSFRGLPTLANTVYVLDQAHWSNWRNKWEVERRLAAIDDPNISRSEESDRQDQVREGSDRLFNLLTKRRVFTVEGNQ